MIRVFDLHDRAYYAWRDAGIRGAVLVHVDAHHDAAVEPEWKAIDIGNFVRAAMRDGLVAAVRWVVPDPMWRDDGTRAILQRELERIRQPGGDIRMGPLDSLARGVERPVLLDVDVDYLLTDRYEDARSAEPLDQPWCTTGHLAARLRSLDLGPAVTTIAMSVTGGFTPIRWAHLAGDLAARLEGREPPPDEAARAFADALDRLSAGELDAARAAYRRAVALDGFYAHPFRTRGPYLLRRGRLDDAEAAFRDGLALDEADPYAHAGLALVALRRQQWPEALRLARRALAFDADLLDGWRTAGEAAARLGDPAAALPAYQRALALSLHGAQPLGGPWSSNPERRLVDPYHWDDHRALADLHDAAGSAEAAAAHRRMAAAGAPVLPS